MKLIFILCLFISLPAFSVEFLEEGQKELKTTIDGEVLAETTFNFQVLKTELIEIYECDYHPDDPLCEPTGEYYYDFTTFKYIEALRKQTNFKFFMNDFTNEEVNSYTWDEIKDFSIKKDFSQGIMVIYWSEDNKKLPGKVLKSIANQHL